MKNKILKIITVFMVSIMMLGTCGIDSDSIIPTIMILMGLSWMFLFGYANDWFEKVGDSDETV